MNHAAVGPLKGGAAAGQPCIRYGLPTSPPTSPGPCSTTPHPQTAAQAGGSGKKGRRKSGEGAAAQAAGTSELQLAGLLQVGGCPIGVGFEVWWGLLQLRRRALGGILERCRWRGCCRCESEALAGVGGAPAGWGAAARGTGLVEVTCWTAAVQAATPNLTSAAPLSHALFLHQVMHLLANPPTERRAGGDAMDEDEEEEERPAVPLERQVVAQVVDALFDRWDGLLVSRREVMRMHCALAPVRHGCPGQHVPRFAPHPCLAHTARLLSPAPQGAHAV